MHFDHDKIVQPASKIRAVMFLDAQDYTFAVRNDERRVLSQVQADLEAAQNLILDAGGVLGAVRGDGLCAIFESSSSAIDVALDFQAGVATNSNSTVSFRIGIHLGEVHEIGGQPLGDAVNVAARLEALCPPGQINISSTLRDTLRGRADLVFTSGGTPFLKNIGDFVEIFTVERAARETLTGRFKLRLLGPPKLIDPDGQPVSLPDETLAILATLALSQKSGGCDRTWLAAMIWERDAPAAQSVALDRAIAALNALMGITAPSSVVAIAGSQLSLDTGLIDADVFYKTDTALWTAGQGPRLLDGFNFPCPRFQEWAYVQRSMQRSAVCIDAPGDTAGLPQVPKSNPAHFTIRIEPTVTRTMDDRAGLLLDFLFDLLSSGLTDTEALEIQDFRYRDTGTVPTVAALNGPDLLLIGTGANAGSLYKLSLSALRPEDRRVVWTKTILFDQEGHEDETPRKMAEFVGHATDELLSVIAGGRHVTDDAAHKAAKTAISAVHNMLIMTDRGLEGCETDLAAAYAIDKKPLYMAWLAYMTTFHVGEGYGALDTELRERAEELARRALEGGRHNGTILGLVAHVYSYVLRDFHTAADLVKSALERSPHRAICWDSASLYYSYTGQTVDAKAAAERARVLGRSSPYRHLFEGACCVAAAANGDFDDAVRWGEGAMALQPEFTAVLRYLAASYGHLGDISRGEVAFDTLKRLDPDLSIDRIRSSRFPAPTDFSANLLETGLKRVGLAAR